MLHKTNFKRIFFSSYLGNVLETYDFVLCGILAQKMSQVFFPSDNEVASLLLMLVAYGVGFVSRPIGAIIFGYIGDLKGRKTALFYSLLGMSVCTMGCGVLPSYETIGITASFLFVILRILQGACIGGEAQGGSTFIVEHFWHHSPASYGAFFATSNGLGALLATAVSLVFLTLNSSDMHVWRYPFIFGALVGWVGFFIRRYVPETPVFEKYSVNKNLSNPILSSFKSNKFGCIKAFFYFALISSITQFGFTFVNIYLSTFAGFEKTTALTFACIGTLLAMGGVGGTGLLLKNFPNKLDAIIQTGSWLSFFIAPIVMLGMKSGNIVQIGLALLLVGLFTGLLCGAAPYFIALQFQHSHRYSGSALVNNLAYGLVGGFFPTIGLFLLNKTQITVLPGLYISGLSLLFLGVNWYLKEEILFDENP